MLYMLCVVLTERNQVGYIQKFEENECSFNSCYYLYALFHVSFRCPSAHSPLRYFSPNNTDNSLIFLILFHLINFNHTSGLDSS